MAASVAASPRARPGRFARWLAHGDTLFIGLTVLFGLVVVVLIVAMGLSLWVDSATTRAQFGLGFFVGTDWDPVSGQFGALPFIYGTLVSSLIAVLFAAPIGIGIAIFLSELAPDWVRVPVGFLVEMLAAIPSIVYGIWGIFVFGPYFRDHLFRSLAQNLGFIPLFKGPVYGPSMLLAGLILAIMIIPTVAAISRDILRSVPNAQREAVLAMGATEWEVISLAVLPYGRAGIIGGIMLGLGRALGETMAVTLVIGNNPQIKASLLQPAYTMASVIANEFVEAVSQLHIDALVEIGLVLLLVSFILNAGARLLVWRVAGGPKGEKRA